MLTGVAQPVAPTPATSSKRRRAVLLDCGPGVLARLPKQGLAHPDAIVITHFHLDHWGDLVPWVWGALLPGRGRAHKPELWVPPRRASAPRAVRRGCSGSPTCSSASSACASTQPEGRSERAAAPSPRRVVPHYRVEAHALRVTRGRAHARLLGRLGPARGARLVLAREADLFLCEATLASRRAVDGVPRGHLSLDEARAAFAVGAQRLVVTHRPAELETYLGSSSSRETARSSRSKSRARARTTRSTHRRLGD